MKLTFAELLKAKEALPPFTYYEGLTENLKELMAIKFDNERYLETLNERQIIVEEIKNTWLYIKDLLQYRMFEITDGKKVGKEKFQQVFINKLKELGYKGDLEINPTNVIEVEHFTARQYAPGWHSGSVPYRELEAYTIVKPTKRFNPKLTWYDYVLEQLQDTNSIMGFESLDDFTFIYGDVNKLKEAPYKGICPDFLCNFENEIFIKNLELEDIQRKVLIFSL